MQYAQNRKYYIDFCALLLFNINVLFILSIGEKQMDNLQNVLCAVGAFALGALVGYINSRITKKRANSDNVASIMFTNFIRMTLDILTLLVVLLVCRHFDLPSTMMLIAAALGLTIFGMLFLRRFTKQLKAADENQNRDGGE